MCEHCNPNVQVVEAESVADYLKRYYKVDRIAATGFDVLLRSYEIELEVYGFVVTSHYDNVTGGLIAWPHFETPKDIHRETTAQVFNVPPEEITEEQRRAAKRINYFGLYSGYNGKEEDNSGIFLDLD